MPIDFRSMFNPERVVDLAPASKDRILEVLVDALATSERVTDRNELLARILERERTLSTGVGIGIALPHVKIPSIRDFVIAVGRCHEGVPFQSIDDKPVTILVMIGCNDSQSGEYMKVLSQIVRALKDDRFRAAVLAADSPGAVVDLFVGPSGVLQSG